MVPDYYARYPKACMGGWGRRLMLIDPAGQALPCHAAGMIPGMQFDNVREHPLEWIWQESAAFQRFRGEKWMPEPCKSCDRRTEDFGGCRCQALLLTGDANATDPVCSLSPDHHLIEIARAAAESRRRAGSVVIPNKRGMTVVSTKSDVQAHQLATPGHLQNFSRAASPRLPAAVDRTGRLRNRHLDADRRPEPACSEDYPWLGVRAGTVSLAQALAFFLVCAGRRQRRRSH